MVQIKISDMTLRSEINLLHEIQEKKKSPEMHTASPNSSIGRQGTLRTHSIILPGKYSPNTKRQLTWKCIVNNNADNINALTTLVSLKNTQNWLKVHHNSKSPMQHCAQYHLHSAVSLENAF
jgi:hypothetical protein